LITSNRFILNKWTIDNLQFAAGNWKSD
jgi:hypothetical protein